MIRVLSSRAKVNNYEGLFSEIKKDLEAIHSGNSPASQVLLIVPAQATLKSEEAAFDYFKCDGFFDFHIMSGNKLNHEILKECGGPGKAVINTLGRSMLLRRIVREIESEGTEFKAFGKIASKPEFIEMAGDFIVQMKQNRLSPENLSEIRGELKEDSLLSRKLSDMQGIYEKYEAEMAGKFTDSEDLLSYVTSKIPESELIKSSIIWYYGFYSFTQRELLYMSEIAENCAGMNIFMTKGIAEDKDSELFSVPQNAINGLKRVCEERGLEFKSEYIESAKEETALAHLERNLFVIPPQEYKGADVNEAIRLVKASNPFTQAETIGAEILRLVREEGLRYGEISVLCPGSGSDANAIKRVLESFGIPVFADEKRSISHTPLVEFVQALLSMAEGNFRTKEIIALIKPEFIETPGLSPSDINSFENYCKLYHISGDKLSKPLKYGENIFGTDEFAKFEKLREIIADIAIPFAKDMGAAGSVKEKSEIFYKTLTEKLNITKVLDIHAAEAEKAGLTDAAEELSQLWNILMSILDQFVELMGDENLSCSEYRQVLEAAFSDVKVGLLPQAEGRVSVGSVTRSDVSGVKALFIAGLNEGQIPSNQASDAILTQRELEEISQLSTPDGRSCIAAKSDDILRREEELTLYKVFSSPENYLWLGYTAVSTDGHASKPSVLINRIKEMFPGLEETSDIENDSCEKPFIQSEAAAASRLSKELRIALESTENVDKALWKQVYNELKEAESHRAEAIKAGLLFSNESSELGEAKAKALFAREGEFSISPSRLENFTGCPFKHFVNYGLKPQEIKEFGIESSNAGDIYHECLMKLSEKLSKSARDKGIKITDPESEWMSASDEELRAYLDEILSDIEEKEYDGVMTSGPKEKYISSRIRKLVYAFSKNMVEQVRSGIISEMYFEENFGRAKGKKFPAVELDTKHGKAYIEGKIDRVDVLEAGGEQYVKIIDYKSGNKKFNRSEAEQGLLIQLGLYMESTLGSGKYKPAGMFYYRISEKEIDAELNKLTAETISEDITAAIAKEYRMNGIFIDNMEIIEAMDSGLEPGVYSNIIQARLTKEKKLDSRSKAISEEEFEEFRAVFKESIRTAAERLLSGETNADPKTAGKQSACEYCGYRSVCMFDTTLMRRN